MAFPNTVHTTFVNGTVVDPAYLNDYDLFVGHLYNGTRTLKALDIDGAAATAATTIAKGRLAVSGGTALVAGDFALSAGWGAGAGVAVASDSSDAKWYITVTANGAGIAANPTVTLTYKDGAWNGASPHAVRPWVDLTNSTDAAAAGASTWITTANTTTLVFQLRYTPLAGQQYEFRGFAIG